jgi:hypothetical protein
VARDQGDQIGRIFALKFFDNYGCCPNFWATFIQGNSCILILAKSRLGYILGDFFHQLIWSPCSGHKESGRSQLGRMQQQQQQLPDGGNKVKPFRVTWQLKKQKPESPFFSRETAYVHIYVCMYVPMYIHFLVEM